MLDPMVLPHAGYHPPPLPTATSPDPPIDPSLAIDPAILGDCGNNDGTSPSLRPASAPPPQSPPLPRAPSSLPPPLPHHPHPHFDDQGPQGDPFAPPPNQVFLPRLPSPPRGLKRKRRTRPAVRRDDECSFCQGDDAHNKSGHAEQMVSCVACGRSGHPSCLSIDLIPDVLRSYPWHCIECKTCEVCERKGNGNRMLFCDACDRGWHMDCLEPPLEDTPPGNWVCPLCTPISLPPLPHDGQVGGPSSPAPPVVVVAPSASPLPHSAASSSPPRSRNRAAGRNGRRRSRDRVGAAEDERRPRVRHKYESSAAAGRRGRSKLKGKAAVDVKGKGRARAVNEDDDGDDCDEDDDDDDDARVPSFVRPQRSLRLHLSGPKGGAPRPSSSSLSPVRAARKVRLVVRRPRRVHDDDEGGADGGDEADEERGSPSRMFEGILTPAQCSTAHTGIHESDKALFSRSRTRAEMKLGPPVAPLYPSALLASGSATPNTSAAPTPAPSFSGSGLLHALRTRHSVAQALHLQAALETSSPVPTPPPPQAAHTTPNHNHHHHHHHHHQHQHHQHPLGMTPLPPRIRTIRFGEFDVDTWYDAPFPEEYASVSDGKLWFCEFCLKYMKSRFQTTRHRMKCKARHPPGDEIYRDGAISVFEVDGRKNKIYCQNLCLLSKMFLDHKSLFYDVEPFLFYVMTEVDRLGARFVGYFSKEKRSPKDYNVSCIMTLPVRQRKGWGNILIDFSYLLSKKEGRVGSPERPLSALGSLAYKQYWTHTVKMFLHGASPPVTLEAISQATSMTLEDIYNTLKEQNMVTAKEVSPPPPPRPPPGTPIKYLRGRKNGPGITRRGPLVARTTKTKEDPKRQLVIPTEYTIHWDREALDAYVVAWQAKEHVTIKARCLRWSPFLLSKEPQALLREAADKAQQQPEGAASVGDVKDGASAAPEPQSPPPPPQPHVAPTDVASPVPRQVDASSTLLALATAAEMQSSILPHDNGDGNSVGESSANARRTRGKSASRGTSLVVEEEGGRDNASDRGRRTTLTPRVLRARNRDRPMMSVERAAGGWSSPSASESLSQKVLRSSAKKRNRGAEGEKKKDMSTRDDRASAVVKAAQRQGGEEEGNVAGPRRTRASSQKFNQTKPLAPQTMSPTRRGPPPRKRRRVETSSEPDRGAADADGSLSELTRTSRSPSPAPPPRVFMRTRDGRFTNGKSLKSGSGGSSGGGDGGGARAPNSLSPARAAATDAWPPLASGGGGVRSSSRINGVAHPPAVLSDLKQRPLVLDAVQVGRTRSSMRRTATATTVSSGEQKDIVREPSSRHNKKETEDGGGGGEDEASISLSLNDAAAATTDCINGTGPDGDGGQGDTVALLDEDALGEEDAEGEEDLEQEDL